MRKENRVREKTSMERVEVGEGSPGREQSEKRGRQGERRNMTLTDPEEGKEINFGVLTITRD